MPVKIKMDLSGKDSTFGSNCGRYYRGLLDLQLYKNAPEKCSLERIKGELDCYLMTSESAVNGDRVEIAKRNKARKQLAETLKLALLYLRSVAEEDDIPALMQAGFEVYRSGKRRSIVAPAT